MAEPLTILIIDDDQLHCWFWQRTLENRYGTKVRIDTVLDAREALSRLDGNLSLILLDWHMPHLDVPGFLEKAGEKGIGPERFILFSGSDKSLAEEAFGSAGFLAVVEKGRTDQETELLRLIDGAVKRPKPA